MSRVEVLDTVQFTLPFLPVLRCLGCLTVPTGRERLQDGRLSAWPLNHPILPPKAALSRI